MCKLTLTTGLCLIIASLGVPSLARHLPVYRLGYGNPCYGRQDGLYPNPNDRHSFYNCVWGRAYIQKCPLHLVYKHSITTCYYPGSSESSSSSHEDTPLTTTSPPFTATSPHTTTPFTATSPPTTTPFPATSPPTTTPFPTTSPPTTTPFPITSPPTTTPFPTTSSPTTTPFPTTSPPTTTPFTTTNSPATPIDTTATNPLGSFCTGRPDGQYTNPYDQHSFLSCVAGLTYIIQCPANLVYVQDSNRCDYSNSATTNGTPLTTTSPPTTTPFPTTSPPTTTPFPTTSPPTTTPFTTTSSPVTPIDSTGTNPLGSFCTGRPDGQYTNPYDQHSFLSCVAGLTYIMPCPANLVYVQATNRCDYHL